MDVLDYIVLRHQNVASARNEFNRFVFACGRFECQSKAVDVLGAHIAKR